MKVVLAGGTGFLGRALVQKFLAQGHSVTVLTRNTFRAARTLPSTVRCAEWDGATVGDWMRVIDGSDAVLNFCGESVGEGRWTSRRKRELIESRARPANALIEAIARAERKPHVLVSASGVGYYGDCGDEILTEENGSGIGFLAEMAVAWEGAVLPASESGVRVATLRMGVVVGDRGGALERMVIPYRLFVGGALGSGDQWFPWVHRDDVVGIVTLAIHNEAMVGPINVVAPESVTMRQFGATLGRVLHRPSWLPVPGPMVRVVLGEMAEMVLSSQRVVPVRLLRMGYRFAYPELFPALMSWAS